MCCDCLNKLYGSTPDTLIGNHDTVNQPASSYDPKYLVSNDYRRSPWILKN
jgi:hypothetical protein